ncbi:Hsp20/alpha crystallin family protein [Streptosporangium amethystogenes]|uniref:Hsp20/alpha crystallin family protein n=1 Tax=Streptosporangium amethystogenes TaxID=2002 RepID=UPI00068B023A|nr:Hsp20/alpha crystallin family protein [Streptosporangium amethystogenes]
MHDGFAAGIDVETDDRELVVTAEVKEKETAGRPHRTGRFEHRVLLLGEVNPEQISAPLPDHVLTMTAPKAQKARPTMRTSTPPDHLPGHSLDDSSGRDVRRWPGLYGFRCNS